jgi:hypothetical protein
MSILCALGGHEAAADETYNGGYYFSSCRRCRCDMIRSGASWGEVPRGHRVVWKDGRHSHSMEPNHAPVLPTPHHHSKLPAVRTPFASWRRDLVGVGVPGCHRTNGGSAGAAVAQEEMEERNYRYLLAFAAVLGAGLQLVMSLRAMRSAFQAEL